MQAIKKKISGFTLIELLVVIAIVAILASVVLSKVSGGKGKAQDAKTFASLRSAQQVATYCLDGNQNLSVPNIGNPICAGQENWPAPVGSGWVYADFGSCTFDGDVSDNTFSYCVHNGVSVISCSQNGCLKS
jgi:type IV pilus assembly protein PilA